MNEITENTRKTIEKLLSVRELAGFLGVSPRMVQHLAKRGDLPCVKIGRCLRFEMADVRAFIEKQKTGKVLDNYQPT
jgi:excisionase family DNA binding protein